MNRPASPEELTLLREAKAYLQNRYQLPLQMKEVAQHFSVSEYRIQTLFAKHEGCTVYAYLKQLRMEQAEELLRNTLLPIGEIAKEVGYESHSKFSRAFTQFAGKSPLQFRKTQSYPAYPDQHIFHR